MIILDNMSIQQLLSASDHLLQASVSDWLKNLKLGFNSR